MKRIQRKQAILKYLEEHGALKVDTAVIEFDVSPATARRDFVSLASEELVEKYRGGVRKKRIQRGGMTPFSLRETRNSMEKLAIAKRAAEFINAEDVLMIDGGTSTLQLVRFLPDIKLRIITNSLRLAGELSVQCPTSQHLPEIIITGGTLYNESFLLAGRQTKFNLEQYYADIAFLSVGGITINGITNTNERVVESEQVMVEHSEKVIVMADHSKIGQKAMCHVVDIDKIDLLITDEHPDSAAIIEQLRQAGLEVITVPVKAEV